MSPESGRRAEQGTRFGDVSHSSYRFGEFRLDVPRMRLSGADGHLEVEPKALRVLLYLVEHRDRLVPKNELLEVVWAGAVVTDNSLTHAIAQIRRVLRDDAREPRFVETAHVLGYRFIAPVTVEATPPSGTDREDGTHPRSLAVLPLVDMTSARDRHSLCDGISEELIHVLTRLASLHVVSRTSSFAFRDRSCEVREIGRRLGVDAVIEGSVRRADGRLRVTVQLVAVADGCHLWSERFDRGDSDEFGLEDEIARRVAARLVPEPTPAPTSCG